MTRDQSNLQKKNPTLGTIELARKNEETVLGFYDATGLGGAIGKSQFDLQEEVDTIISHIRDSDPKVSLAALKHFRSVLKDVVGTGGHVAHLNRTHQVNGGEVSMTTSLTANTLISNLRKENEVREVDKEVLHEVHPAQGSNNQKAGSAPKAHFSPNNTDIDDDDDLGEDG